MVLGGAGRFVEEQVADTVSKLISSASPDAMAGIFKLYEKVSREPLNKLQAHRFRRLIEDGHAFGQWLQRVVDELNPKARTCLIRNLYGYSWFIRGRKTEAFQEKHGFRPPSIVVFDVTARCNLKCEGCWAAMYGKDEDLPYEVLERVITEAEEEMGTHFFVLTGGEPTLRRDLYRLYRGHDRSQFQLYTNGTLIDDEMAAEFADCGNVMPMLSIEGDAVLTDDRRGGGTHERVLDAMRSLREHGVLFGFSATATVKNAETIMSDAFIERMIECGCLYGWYFQYIPIGRSPNPDLMVTPEQRDMMRRRVYELRNTYPIFLADFWNDGPEVNGCLAGGRRYLHITNSGDVEPCVFCHFAVDNIKETTLVEALESPFMRSIREGIPYDGNLLRPCMLIDRPQVFRRHAAQHGARPTHPGAESLINELADDLDKRAAAWARLADEAWQAGDALPMYPYPPEATPDVLCRPSARTAAGR